MFNTNLTTTELLNQADAIAFDGYETGDHLLWQNPDGSWRIVRIGQIFDNHGKMYRIDFECGDSWASTSFSESAFNWELSRMDQDWAGRLVFDKWEQKFAHLLVEAVAA